MAPAAGESQIQIMIILPIDSNSGAIQQRSKENLSVAGVFAFRGTQPWSLSDWIIDFDHEKRLVDWWLDPGADTLDAELDKGNSTTSSPKLPMVSATPSVHAHYFISVLKPVHSLSETRICESNLGVIPSSPVKTAANCILMYTLLGKYPRLLLNIK